MADLNLEEINEITKLENKIKKVKFSNDKKNKYYYQQNKIKDLGINTPFSLRGLQVLLGWSKMSVDVIEERIKWRGFYNPLTSNQDLNETAEWLNGLYRDNFFESEQKLAQKDALITGTGFISVAPGNTEIGEPEVLWIAENSSTITVEYNRRTRDITSAFKLIQGKGKQNDKGILWLPDATIEVEKVNSKWVEISRDDHEIGVVGVVPIFNNSDSRYIFGRSEITRSLRDLNDSAMRTFLNAEINREYYAKPFRFMTGLSIEDIQTIDKNGVKVVKNSAGDMITLPFNEDVNNPDIKQLSANDPNGVMNMIEPIARLAAREIGVPPSYLGFDSVNPTSADAINAAESALTHKADQRVAQLKRTYKRLGFVSLVVSGRAKPEDWNAIDTIFDRTETLSPSAASDRAAKLNAIGLYDRALPDFVYREVGLSDAEITELKSYLQGVQSSNIINMLLEDSENSTIDDTAVTNIDINDEE